MIKKSRFWQIIILCLIIFGGASTAFGAELSVQVSANVIPSTLMLVNADGSITVDSNVSYQLVTPDKLVDGKPGRSTFLLPADQVILLQPN